MYVIDCICEKLVFIMASIIHKHRTISFQSYSFVAVVKSSFVRKHAHLRPSPCPKT